jgi:hypothetical protein
LFYIVLNIFAICFKKWREMGKENYRRWRVGPKKDNEKVKAERFFECIAGGNLQLGNNSSSELSGGALATNVLGLGSASLDGLIDGIGNTVSILIKVKMSQHHN